MAKKRDEPIYDPVDTAAYPERPLEEALARDEQEAPEA